MKISVFLQRLAVAGMILSAIGMVMTPAHAQDRPAYSKGFSTASAPVDINPGMSGKIGDITVVNNTDKRCVASRKHNGDISVGCSDLGPTKSTPPPAQTPGSILIEKGKDQWGKADAVSLRVSQKLSDKK